MDQIENYISSQRAVGQTDEQIKQTLATNGWTPEQIQAAFPFTKNQKPKTGLVLGIVLILVLITCVGLATAILVMPNKNKTAPVTTQGEPPVASLPVVVYIKYSPEELNAGSGDWNGKFTLFDFSVRQSFSPALPEGHVDDFGKIISPWSPSGRYLFLLGVRENSLPQPLFVYDNEIKKLSYLFDTNTVPELKGNYSEFSFSSSWIEDQRLLYTKSISIDTSGTVSTVTAPEAFTQSNGRLKILQSGIIETGAQTAILDGKPLPGLKGRIAGMTNKYIVTIEKPVTKNPIEDPELQRQLTGIQNEEEAKRILDQAYKPTGDSTIYLYSTSNPDQVLSIPWPENSWATEAIEPLYSKNSLIIHEVDSNLVATKNRFTLINLDNPDSQKIIAEIGRLNKEIYISGEGSIGITPDEQWMVLFLESENPDSIGITGKIAAWNLETGEVLTICEAGCSSVKVYNPYKLKFR
jgi:hypothetical protein